MDVRLYFRDSELELIETTHPRATRRVQRCSRGIYPQHDCTGTFTWSAGVQAVTYLAIKTALSEAAGERATYSKCIQGNKGSLASSLDGALDKPPQWLRDMFGEDESGEPLASSFFVCKNRRGRRARDVTVGFVPEVFVSIVDSKEERSLCAKDLNYMLQVLFMEGSGRTPQLRDGDRKNHRTYDEIVVVSGSVNGGVDFIRTRAFGTTQSYQAKIPDSSTGSFSEHSNVRACQLTEKLQSPTGDIFTEGNPYSKWFPLSWFENIYEGELVSSLSNTRVFSERYVAQAIRDILQYAKALGESIPNVGPLVSQDSDATRYGLIRGVPLPDVLDCEEITLHASPAHLGTLSIFNLITRYYRLPVTYNILNIASHKLTKHMRDRNLRRSDVFALTIPAGMSELCDPNSAYIPLSLMPCISHAMMESGKPSRSSLYGFIGLDRAFEYNLKLRSKLHGREGIQRELTNDSQVEAIIGSLSSSSFRTATVFPLNHLFERALGCRTMPVNTSGFISCCTVLFVPKDLIPNAHISSMLISAIRDCWLKLLESHALRFSVVGDILQFPGYIEFLLRYSTISQHMPQIERGFSGLSYRL